MKTIKLINIKKQYKKNVVLEDVNYEFLQPIHT